MTQINQPIQLELVDTKELINELQTRFDHCVFAGILEKTDKESFNRFQWHGNLFMCMGITAAAQHIIVEQIKSLHHES